MATDNEAVFADGQLTFIGKDCHSIPPHLVECYGSRVKRLDLSFNCLSSLDRINQFPNLEELIVDNNELSDDLVVASLPFLHTLMLNKNLFTNLDALLDQLSPSKFPALTYLSLLGNKACPNQLSSAENSDDDYIRYRLYVLHRLPNLKFLDASPITLSERREAKQKGEFLKVLRPTEITGDQGSESRHEDSPYTPLPAGATRQPKNKAHFGKSKYVYYGRHSEGNRFIRNNDL
ncbi:hypothetical protein CAPTEDRAFT_174488 [Capitella teleta]|uniref:U2A'/phosphoprotein 32 family A C-terminal domain-containing protein n=1 Tax=Capitella teleta TaxID=283909 RepID=R7V191_CAPTE|nr:hypothetical protein CAPTEDRAFT_174488 [Capitella teleta]|eukprot:ELU12247.1 hypothetical protein CAPTEDRAFT_174488 [Capitella teleta]